MSYERVIFVAGLNEVVHGSKRINKTQMLYLFEGEMVPIGTWQQLCDERSNIGVSTVYSPILQRNLGDIRQLQGKVFIYI